MAPGLLAIWAAFCATVRGSAGNLGRKWTPFRYPADPQRQSSQADVLSPTDASNCSVEEHRIFLHVAFLPPTWDSVWRWC